MLAIYKRELRAYFTSFLGWLFIAFLCAVCGIYAMVNCFKNGTPNFERVLYYICFLFIIAIPILTMRCLAEDRKQKTDTLLYALPLGMPRVVIGKYLAALTVFACPVLVFCLYPPILAQYGTVSYSASYCGILGYFFLGAALIAMGVFASSITDSQVVAAVACFALVLISYLMSSLAYYLSSTGFASLCAFAVLFVLLGLLIRFMTHSTGFAVGVACAGILVCGVCYFFNAAWFEGLFPRIMSSLSVFDRFSAFVYGSLDLTAIVFDLTVIVLFLFFAASAMEKRRWSE